MDNAKIQKHAAFVRLAAEAASCGRCESMCDRSAVLGPLNGALSPRVMFVAEAPGRQGADRTRRPFYGDKSGEHFQAMLDSIGLAREEIFITNTVLCSPRSVTGANRKPSRGEINNCSPFLRQTVDLIDPPIVVTLGAVALEALKSIDYHRLSLKENFGRTFDWYGRVLIPLYHPSPQVLAAVRSASDQIADFRVVGRALQTAGRRRRPGSK